VATQVALELSPELPMTPERVLQIVSDHNRIEEEKQQVSLREQALEMRTRKLEALERRLFPEGRPSSTTSSNSDGEEYSESEGAADVLPPFPVSQRKVKILPPSTVDGKEVAPPNL